MNVSSILRRKGTQVETLRTGATVGEAAQRLHQRGIGSLVVLGDGGEIVGVLAERDIVRALAEHGTNAWALAAEAVLPRHPATCKPQDSLESVMSVMTMRRSRHLPVLAGEALVGLVSIGDVVKCRLDELKLEVGVLRDYARAAR